MEMEQWEKEGSKCTFTSPNLNLSSADSSWNWSWEHNKTRHNQGGQTFHAFPKKESLILVRKTQSERKRKKDKRRPKVTDKNGKKENRQRNKSKKQSIA